MFISNNITHISGIILATLISVGVISYTNKFIFEVNTMNKPIFVNQIYDPDHGLNISHVCVLSKKVYSTTDETSPCYNKTLILWYNPWIRYHLWSQFWIEKETTKHVDVEETVTNNIENETTTTTEAPPLEKDKPEIVKPKEKSFEYVYSILVGLLIMSVIATCWEVSKDKLKRNEGAGNRAQDRQCSLADFTINRHLRRETQQQAASHLTRQASFELPAKVTQNLIHQSSLDRAFPKLNSEVKPNELRRNSMPSFRIGILQQNDNSRRNVIGTPSKSAFRSKTLSFDATGEEMSLETRKKSRHFIRRH